MLDLPDFHARVAIELAGGEHGGHGAQLKLPPREFDGIDGRGNQILETVAVLELEVLPGVIDDDLSWSQAG